MRRLAWLPWDMSTGWLHAPVVVFVGLMLAWTSWGQSQDGACDAASTVTATARDGFGQVVVQRPANGSVGSAAHAVNTSRTATEAESLTTYDPNLYLFIDDHWIEKQAGLTRLYNQARPLDKPIIWPDDPKTETDCAWGNVIREPDGRYRLWYATMTMGHNNGGPHEIASAGVWGRGDDFTFRPRSDADRPPVESMLGKYAESTDGIAWIKPKLGLFAYRGSRDNNIVLTGQLAAKQTDGALTNFDGYTILRDQREADPQRRRSSA